MIRSATAIRGKDWRWLVALLIVVSIMGCSAPKPCVVTGTVAINNVPASGVYVMLHTANGETAGSGRTDKDGAFRLTVAQAGDYPITCFFPTVTKVMDDIIEGEDQLQGRYRDWQKPVVRAAVRSGETQLPPIQLQ